MWSEYITSSGNRIWNAQRNINCDRKDTLDALDLIKVNTDIHERLLKRIKGSHLCEGDSEYLAYLFQRLPQPSPAYKIYVSIV